MRLVVFADLHLDAAFAWSRPDTARLRRLALRDTLLRIVALADEVDADALLCAGDLYEDERFTPDTRAFLHATFAGLTRPIYIAPGNHDWFGPRSIHAGLAELEPVHMFTEARLTPVPLGPGVTLWGGAFRKATRTRGFLDDDFRVQGEGLHLALFHGSEQSGLPAEVSGKSPHAPFAMSQIDRAGLLHAFVGHHHRPLDAPRMTYPGNPDPLTFGENGERGAVIVEIDVGAGTIRTERRVVATSAVHDLVVDITDCQNLQQLREKVLATIGDRTGDARLTLTGEVAPEIELDTAALQADPHGLRELVVRTANLRPGYDLEALAAEATIRGRFVRDVGESAELDDEERRRILLTGLRALDGRVDLEVL